MKKAGKFHDMTVGDLIDLLSQHPRDMLVAVNGYEDGNTTHIRVGVEKNMLREDAPAWAGEYENSRTRSENDVPLLVLSREDR